MVSNNAKRIALIFSVVTASAGCGSDSEPCAPGAEGCGETPVVCDAHNCVPDSPQCWSPCAVDRVDEQGVLHICSAEGLMPGCIGDTTCVDGSCVLPGAAAPACRTAAGCPDFQTCLDGRCYSTCADAMDCKAGARCHRKVCRPTCETSGDCTDPGTACSSDRVCEVVVQPAATSARSRGTFSVTPAALDLDPDRSEGAFTITNPTPTEVTFLVRKAKHRIRGVRGEVEIQLASEGASPMPWVHLGVPTPLRVQEIPVTVPAFGQREVVIARASRAETPSWDGVLEVDGGELGTRRVRLHHTGHVAGRWAGQIYYFGSFPDGRRAGRAPLDAWMASRDDVDAADRVPNAFLKAWVRFRNGQLSFEQMMALLQSTITGSWQFSRVAQLCSEAGYGEAAACAPYGGAGSASVIPYTSAAHVDLIPSGVVELSFAMNLAAGASNPACSGQDYCLVGRVDSEAALQYGGDPQVVLRFASDPASPDSCARLGGDACITYLDRLEAHISVGGRVPPDAGDTCGREGFERVQVPWLVPGFAPPGGAEGLESECRDTDVPLASANPVPDGVPRRRSLELVDGVALNQQQMLLILREAIEPFHGGAEDIYGYAFVVLERANRDLEPEEVQGQVLEDDRELSSGLQIDCSAELLEAVAGRGASMDGLTGFERDALANAVVTGRSSATVTLPVLGAVEPHYVCVFNEVVAEDQPPLTRSVFDAGPDGAMACPPGSLAVYFGVDDADAIELGIEDHACHAQRPQNCLETLSGWLAEGRALHLMVRDRARFPQATGATFDLGWQCAVPDRASCDDDLYDLRQGKTFFLEDDVDVFFSPLASEIHQAFRYRTQFVSRAGKNIGFSPSVCQPGADLVPYCYDPTLLGRITARIDCALELYHHSLGDPLYVDASTQTRLRRFLQQSFGVLQQANPVGDPVLERGFEHLYAELLINLGDDAVTKALSSRFDLGQTNQLSFPGSQFETDGVDISGIAGFELYQLHRATQYYELVLDRFYRLSPSIWQDLTGADPFPYITQSSISYLDRVIRASAQLSNAYSEIAERYQSFNRPDLARRVLERAYVRAYQESLILSEVLDEVAKIVSPSEVAQVARAVEQAQRRFRIGMLAMQDQHERLNEGLSFFGFPADYIPFPALDEDDVNGFEVMMDRAQGALDAAAEQEQRALDARRGFDVDEADFQAELVDLRVNYHTRLGELCGTFVAEDGRVYPAIREYAHLSPELAGFDDPCGAKSGEIWLQGGEIDVRRLDITRVQQEIRNVQTRAELAEGSVGAQCALIREDVAAFLANQRVVNGYEKTIETLEFTNSVLDKTLDFIDGSSSRALDVALGEASPVGRAVGGVAIGIWAGAALVHLGATTGIEYAIKDKRAQIRERELAYEEYNIGRECDYLNAELVFTVREIHLDMDLLELDALEAIWGLETEVAVLGSLQNERRRVLAEWADTKQLALDAAAALNDPNTRIMRNDAVLSADRTFERALRDAYRATKVFEYYTAQSYPDQERLYFARMVDGGDYNLRRYLADLDDAYFEFEDGRGNPDTRVARISVRDDVLRIPRYAEDGSGRPMTLEQRVAAFRTRLQDPALLDDNGWLTLAFPTSFEDLSPITYNHKVLFIEVELFGDTGGDPIGRVYLRQVGTGVVQDGTGDRLYYAFPRRTAVINPVMDGNRDYGQDSDGAIAGPSRSIFRSFRFRERPVVNTNWELVLNQRTEAVNEDINLGGLDDIEVHIFYTDFTAD